MLFSAKYHRYFILLPVAGNAFKVRPSVLSSGIFVKDVPAAQKAQNNGGQRVVEQLDMLLVLSRSALFSAWITRFPASAAVVKPAERAGTMQNVWSRRR